MKDFIVEQLVFVLEIIVLVSYSMFVSTCLAIASSFYFCPDKWNKNIADGIRSRQSHHLYISLL